MTALVVCCTYGRIPYLGKMLSGFLNQTYEDKHLVIINDDTNITLKCNYHNVSVINCTRRLLLSEKRNIGASYGYYDLIFPWDDDDIFLPGRIQNHVDQYVSNDIEAYRNSSAYILYNGYLSEDIGGINNISYKKDTWFKYGGYLNKNIIGEDTEFLYKIQNCLIEENSDKRDFIYGFSNSNYHLSCNPPNLEELAFNQLKNLKLLNKTYWIEPDDEEYFKYVKLEEIYRSLSPKRPIKVNILNDGNIDISTLITS